MGRTTLIFRSLVYFWRSHVAVGLGVVTATATLTGALLVGESMRTSLRHLAVGRLGRITHTVTTPSFFGELLATDLLDDENPTTPGIRQAVPAILMRGGATHADSQAHANGVTILGIDARFRGLTAKGASLPPQEFTGRSVVLNQTLANELKANVGDDVLLKVGKPSTVPVETLLGRRDDATSTLRLKVAAVVSSQGIGSFSPNARQSTSYNAWVPLATLQRSLDQRGRANALLLETEVDPSDPWTKDTTSLEQALHRHISLADAGLRIRVARERGYVSLESEAMLIDPAVETAAEKAANDMGVPGSVVLTYLANSIRMANDTHENPTLEKPRRAIPYSTVSAVEIGVAGATPILLVDGRPAPPIERGKLLLNEWAADDLGAEVGQSIELAYYVTGPGGTLETRTTVLQLQGVARMNQAAADPGFTPDYKGITDAKSLADWDPPFPLDLSLVRDKDDTYWKTYRTAPKAFLSVADGRSLWAEQGERFGRATSIRFRPDERSLDAAAQNLEAALLKTLEPPALGFRVKPIRAQVVESSAGSTDFGMLFIGFSFFLIASASMLVALLFRLGAEQRAKQIGLLLATGYPARQVAKLIRTEGLTVAIVGSAIGLPAAVGYAWLMLAGLRTLWVDAVGTSHLQLHVSWPTFAIGFVASIVVALSSIAWSMRGLVRSSPSRLLAGHPTRIARTVSTRRRRPTIVMMVGLLTAVALLLLTFQSDAVSASLAFFGSGSAMLVACLAAFAIWLSGRRDLIARSGHRRSLVWLGINNAPRHPGRSLLTAGLIASASFVIAGLDAFRLETSDNDLNKNSGTGGFACVVQADTPLTYDLGTKPGREALSLEPATSQWLDQATTIPFRLQPGDESSCLNLYRPTQPRILGATETMIARGGFVFASSLAETKVERDNPWLLLNRTFSDGAIPAIGDMAAVMWQLHSGLGQDLVMDNAFGEAVTLRFVALLDGSILQDELIVGEQRFVELFPKTSGYGFFLVEADPKVAELLEPALERDLSAFAVEVTSSVQRLAAYQAVQNTYLSTFQTLGGLGLLLGVVGLLAVLLRNIWERRSELALMRALGFARSGLGWIVLAENVFLIVAGLIAGVIPAMLAITPHILARPNAIPWTTLLATLVGVLVVGVGGGVLALQPTLRAPLLAALRQE